MGFSKQEYWSGVSLPSPECLTRAAYFLGLEAPGLPACYPLSTFLHPAVVSIVNGLGVHGLVKSEQF